MAVKAPAWTLGLEYGTNSVRALLADVADGREVASAAWTYAHGAEGVILSRDPNFARQHPADYMEGARRVIFRVLAAALREVRGFQAEQVISIGVDTTGSTPIPVDATGCPLGLQRRWSSHPAAMAWLW